MKSGLRILSLTAVVMASVATFAVADGDQASVADGTTPVTQQRAAKFKQLRENKMARWAATLEPTDAQQAQIKVITSAARQTNAPSREKLAADRKQIKALSSTIPFDETAVRALIASDEAVRTDLAVSRIKVQNQIQAVLTPEQQTIAKELRQLASNRHHQRGNRVF